MKALSVISYIIAVIITAAGVYYLIEQPHEFGGEAYTYTVNVAYAQAFFTLGLIFFFIGFVFSYFSPKKLKEVKVEKPEVKEENETIVTETTNIQL